MNIDITRNGVTLSLGTFKILKGKRADQEYPAPVVSAENLPDITSWVGTSNLINELQTLLKRRFQSIYADSIDTNGQFNQALFEKYATDFTSAGLKLKEIQTKLDELSAQLSKLIDEGDMSDEGTRASIKELNDQVRAYRQMKEDRQRKPKEEDEEEAAVEVK
jgi:flagellar capping protein FliD